MWTLRDLAEPAGTGPGVAPVVDSSITVAQELFAPYSEDLFSPELDVQALKGMLTQPLTIQVPVASNILAQGVEDESITLPKGKRDYICLVDNMLIIAGEDKPSKVSITPGSVLQELFPALEVTSPSNRKKALLMFINLV
ncbi:hypothetical protein WJX77_001370 [Trebouxia sp. C0004]